MARITIRFSFKTGAPVIGVKGVMGGKCTDVSKFVEEALGEVAERTKTQEFYAKEVETQGQTVKMEQQDG
jgi:glycerol-3-phosphate dehydrogenase